MSDNQFKAKTIAFAFRYGSCSILGPPKREEIPSQYEKNYAQFNAAIDAAPVIPTDKGIRK